MCLSSVLDTAVNKDKSPCTHRVHMELPEKGEESETKQCTVDSGAKGYRSENKMQQRKTGRIYTREAGTV